MDPITWVVVFVILLAIGGVVWYFVVHNKPGPTIPIDPQTGCPVGSTLDASTKFCKQVNNGNFFGPEVFVIQSSGLFSSLSTAITACQSTQGCAAVIGTSSKQGLEIRTAPNSNEETSVPPSKFALIGNNADTWNLTGGTSTFSFTMYYKQLSASSTD
jgi:hypothetical protein